MHTAECKRAPVSAGLTCSLHRPRYSGASKRARTADTPIFNRVLYQLSYRGASRSNGSRCILVDPGTFEVPTSGVSSQRSTV